MFNWMRSEQSNTRDAMAKTMNDFMRKRMMAALMAQEPNNPMPPATFDTALGQGKFDDPNLSAILAMLTKPRDEGGGGGGSFGGMMAMR